MARQCSIEGCNRHYWASGMCKLHYNRVWRTGSSGSPHPKTPDERFWEKVEKTEGCWNWVGAKNRAGYGKFGADSKTVASHRWSYERFVGPIPEGMFIDHMCHNRACVNPAHLRPATNKQNLENLRGAYSNSKSGVRGVSWSTQNRVWRAQVEHNYVNHYCGSFATVAEAEAAVIAKRLELFTHNDADRLQGVA